MNTFRALLLCLTFLLPHLFVAAAENPGQRKSVPIKFLAELSDRNAFEAGDVAISGDAIVVGSIFDRFIDLYEKPTNGWQTTNTPTAVLTCDGAQYCYYPEIYGDTVVAIAETGGGTSFAVDVFVKPSGGWTSMLPTEVLTDPDPLASFVAVAANGENIVAIAQEGGNPGYKAHIDIFGRPSGAWKDSMPSAILTASNGDYFEGLAMSGETIIAGAPEYYRNFGLGAAYIFVEPSGGWVNATETAKLTPTDGDPYGANFGIAVAISTDATEVLVGELFSSSGAGAAFEFTKPSNGWVSTTETAEFTRTSNETSDDGFGTAVAINGNIALVGAEDAGAQYGQGYAYLYQKPSGGWINSTPTTSGTCADRDCGEFGVTLAINGSTTVIGSSNDNGAAWVYGP